MKKYTILLILYTSLIITAIVGYGIIGGLNYQYKLGITIAISLILPVLISLDIQSIRNRYVMNQLDSKISLSGKNGIYLEKGNSLNRSIKIYQLLTIFVISTIIGLVMLSFFSTGYVKHGVDAHNGGIGLEGLLGRDGVVFGICEKGNIVISPNNDIYKGILLSISALFSIIVILNLITLLTFRRKLSITLQADNEQLPQNKSVGGGFAKLLSVLIAIGPIIFILIVGVILLIIKKRKHKIAH